MLARRSTANPPLPPLASPTSPAKTLPEPIVRSNSTASQQHRYHSQRRRSQRHSQRHRPRPPTPKETIEETSSQQVSSTDQQVSKLEQQQVPATEKCIELPNVDCLRIPLPRRMSSLSGHFFFRRRPKSAPSYEIRTSGGEWTATNHTRSTPPYASAMVTEKIPPVRKSTTAVTLPYTDSNVASADRVLPPTHISSSSVPSGEQSAQMRQRHLAPTLGAQPAQFLPVEDDDKAGCGFACNSCWPTTNNMQQQQRASSGDISSHSHYRQSRLAGGGGTGLLPSLASSWAHIYRSRPQAQANSEGQHVGWRERRRIRRQNRSVRVRDVLAYPFQLGYNCLLWWLGPCVGLARECR
ncbi:hypothetical protein GGI03_004760 [Coemansia sp. RSA 2337]|nr:hypothetical protein GGI03_004760 [Coemansia sp. RSA 2337]